MRQRIQRFLILMLPVLFLTGMMAIQGREAARTAAFLEKEGKPGPMWQVNGSAAIPASADNWGLSFPNEGQSPVGNHTYHHPDMSAISEQAAFQKELDSLAALYKETTGKDLPHFYRPPQGKYSEDNLKQAQALGYKTVFWSLAYVDWYTDNQPTPEQAYGKLLPRIHDGAIVLLHSTSRTNAEILDDLLTKWEDMGYTFASLEDLPPCQ